MIAGYEYGTLPLECLRLGRLPGIRLILATEVAIPIELQWIDFGIGFGYSGELER